MNWLILNTNFKNYCIGNNGPFHWAPCSQDLPAMDFISGVISRQDDKSFQRRWKTFKSNLWPIWKIRRRQCHKASGKFHPTILTSHFGLLKKKNSIFAFLLPEVVQFEQLLWLQRQKCIKKTIIWDEAWKTSDLIDLITWQKIPFLGNTNI